jgi:hypothetical protein
MMIRSCRSPARTQHENRPFSSRKLSTRLILIRQQSLWTRRLFFACIHAQHHLLLDLRLLLAGFTLATILCSFVLMALALYLFYAPLDVDLARLAVLWMTWLIDFASVHKLLQQLRKLPSPSTSQTSNQSFSVLHYAPAVPAPSEQISIRSHSQHTSHAQASHSHNQSFNVFVLGLGPRSICLRMYALLLQSQSSHVRIEVSPHETVLDVRKRLGARHQLYRSTKRIHQAIYYTPYGLKPLNSDDTMKTIGMKPDGTLHVRMNILGGSSRNATGAFSSRIYLDSSLQGADNLPDAYISKSTAFTSNTGHFPSQYPDRKWLRLQISRIPLTLHSTRMEGNGKCEL